MNDAHTRYLDAAAAIGRLLVRDTIWDGDACNWLTQTANPNALGDPWKVHACGCGLERGCSGIGLFLARLCKVRHDPLTADVVAGVARLLIHSISEKRGSHDGASVSEVASALTEMTTSLTQGDQRQSLLDCIASMKLGLSKGPPQLGQPPIEQSGAAGKHADDWIGRWESDPASYSCFADPLIADRLIVIWQQTEDASWLDAARAIADHVLAKTEQHGQPWRASYGVEYPPLGLQNGLAGIGHFLLQLSQPRDVPSLT